MKKVKKYTILFMGLTTLSALSAFEPKVGCTGLSDKKCKAEQLNLDKLSTFMRELSVIDKKTLKEKQFLEKFSKEIFGVSLELFVSRADEEEFFQFFRDIKHTVNNEYRELGSVNVSEARPSGTEPHELFFSWESGDKVGEIILKFKAI